MFQRKGKGASSLKNTPSKSLLRSPKSHVNKTSVKDESRSRSRSNEKEETYSHYKVKITKAMNKIEPQLEDSPQKENLPENRKHETLKIKKNESPKKLNGANSKPLEKNFLHAQYNDYLSKNLFDILKQKAKNKGKMTSIQDFCEDKSSDDDKFFISKLVLGGDKQSKVSTNHTSPQKSCATAQDSNENETDSTLSDKNLNIYDEKSNSLCEEVEAQAQAPHPQPQPKFEPRVQTMQREAKIISEPFISLEKTKEEEEFPEVQIVIDYNEEDFATQPEDEQEIYHERIRPPTDEKLNLVLDLDETLLNSLTLPKCFDLNSLPTGTPRSAINEIFCGGCHILVILRPYLIEFLERVSKFFNIYIYSLGRYEYVMAALDVFDKERKYINRSRVFKKRDCSSKPVFQKSLANLNMTAEQREKTLILDDIPNIWVESNKVISSRKFIPFKNLLSKERYNKYPLLVDHTQLSKIKIEKNESFGWLSDHRFVNDLKYYSEIRTKAQDSFQLEALAGFLETTAMNFNTLENQNLEKLYQEKRKDILKGVKILILSGCTERHKTFKELSSILGAEYTENSDVQYMLVDAYLDQFSRLKMQNILANSTKVKVVSIYWLVECFFLLKKISLQDFYGNSSLKVKLIPFYSLP